MAPSMRRQTLQRKRSQDSAAQGRIARREALMLLRITKYSLRKIAASTSTPKTIVGELKKCLRLRDDAGVNKLWASKGPGRNTVLSQEEEAMIVGRIMFAAERGFAIDDDSIKHGMSRIASDGRVGWRNRVPSDDTVWAFLARRREIIFRKAENKEAAKLRAENRAHAQTLFTALQKVENLHPGILRDGDRVWNVEETAVDATTGAVTKVFCSASGHHWGFAATAATNRPNKHITTVVAVPGSGRKIPPFFIVAGKRYMKDWKDALISSSEMRGNAVPGICSKFFKVGWFPDDGVIKMSENGSMEMALMPALMAHINNCVRIVPADVHYLLCLEGHSSRKGTEWIEYCQSTNFEAVVSAANTSDFLQPCDQDVNRHFKKFN